MKEDVIVSKVTVSRSLYLGIKDSSYEVDIPKVVSALENFQGDKKIISLVSSYQGEGAPEVSYHLGLSLSSSSHRVLIVDATANDQGAFRELRYRVPVSISGYLMDNKSTSHQVLNIESSNVYYTTLYKSELEQKTIPSSERLENFLAGLFQNFDFIFIVAEGQDSIPFAKISQISDASIIVVEAEKTRKPVVGQLVNIIKSNSGAILGFVFNRRPLYIPNFLYSLLYK
jgi:Mrp family chromosome partitioning ATPase